MEIKRETIKIGFRIQKVTKSKPRNRLEDQNKGCGQARG